MIVEVCCGNALTSEGLESTVGANEQTLGPMISNLLNAPVFFEHRPCHEDAVSIEKPIKRQIAHILSCMGATVHTQMTRLESPVMIDLFDELVGAEQNSWLVEFDLKTRKQPIIFYLNELDDVPA